MARRLLVIEGADQGRCFPLPDQGAIILGSSDKHCDICLNDLYAARVHCQIEVLGERVILTDLANTSGTQVNKQKVQKGDVHVNDVIRIGNSHLRLELGEVPAAGQPVARIHVESGGVPQLPLERLAELSGETLGHYELGPVIGQGQLGVIFQARDAKKGQPVALKVLGPDFPQDDGEMQRFVQVMKTLLPLRHPNLVSLIGAGRAGHYCWIARELVAGESAAKIIERHHGSKKIDWHLGFRLAMHIGRALEFAGRHHLSHLNLTPQNILLAADGTAKLNDLMLVKALDGTKLQQATLEKKFLAELPYLSPEQADPEAYADDLCDLYRLGAIVYAVVTGRPPFTSDKPDQLLAQIRTELPEKPRRWQKNIPMEFQAVLLRLLAKHAEERHATPAQLLAELVPIGEAHGVGV
jgi:serine/threonine protein kinase